MNDEIPDWGEVGHYALDINGEWQGPFTEEEFLAIPEDSFDQHYKLINSKIGEIK